MIPCYVKDVGRMAYDVAFELQRNEVSRLQNGEGNDTLYFVEHPHVLTVGRNADGAAITASEALLRERGVTVAETDRGGDVTYHGPGQLVGYPLLRLEEGRRDIRRYVHDLEEVLIRTLADFGIKGRRHDEHRGVWVDDRKIASLGIRISRWVTMHGFALNVSTDLSYFSLLHPCGIVGCEMTSMSRERGGTVAMAAVKFRLGEHFADVFGRELIVADADTGNKRTWDFHVG